MSPKNHNFVLKREVDGEPFVAALDDKTVSLKPFTELDQFALAEIFATAEDVTLIQFRTSVLSLAASSEDLAILRGASLKNKEIEALYSAYMAHNGADEGESSASVD